MHSLADFFAACLRSGALFETVCALIIVPPLVWAACRTLAPSIKKMAEEPAWQAPVAAAACVVPGAVFVSLGSLALMRGLDSACLTQPVGRALMIAGSAALLAGFTRATVLAMRRLRETHALIHRARSADGELAEIAASIGVSVRVIDDTLPLCALAGIFRMTVLVSTAAQQLLTAREMRAALHHERAHARCGDQLLALLITFFVDLLPLPSGDLVRTYRLARERAADRKALAHAPMLDLASALVRIAKGARLAAATMSLVGDGAGSIESRLHDLIHRPEAASLASRIRRIVVIALLFAYFAIAVGGPAVARTASPSCPMPKVATAHTVR